jgi:rhodanese-related sulfurtransferase
MIPVADDHRVARAESACGGVSAAAAQVLIHHGHANVKQAGGASGRRG